jgi:hypothetical protein
MSVSILVQSKFYSRVTEPPHFYAAPAPSLLFSNPNFLEEVKIVVNRNIKNNKIIPFVPFFEKFLVLTVY